MPLTRFRSIAVIVALLVAATTAAASQAVAKPEGKLVCTGTVTGGSYKSVTVPEFASCTLIGVTVKGNVFAKNTPGDVKVLDSTVGHNIMVDGATGLVQIGNAGCKVDPSAGNNIKVTNSNDVLICQETVDNNLMVRGNHGRISIFKNVVGVNIQVKHNLHYDGPFGQKPHPNSPDVIRVRGNTSKHLFVGANADRPEKVTNNTVTG